MTTEANIRRQKAAILRAFTHTAFILFCCMLLNACSDDSDSSEQPICPNPNTEELTCVRPDFLKQGDTIAPLIAPAYDFTSKGDIILFIEEIGENARNIDRILYSLKVHNTNVVSSKGKSSVVRGRERQYSRMDSMFII